MKLIFSIFLPHSQIIFDIQYRIVASEFIFVVEFQGNGVLKGK